MIRFSKPNFFIVNNKEELREAVNELLEYAETHKDTEVSDDFRNDDSYRRCEERINIYPSLIVLNYGKQKGRMVDLSVSAIPVSEVLSKVTKPIDDNIIRQVFLQNGFSLKPQEDGKKDITFKKALTIGFWQCLAMMPGTSRSAASIIGGMQQNLTRKAAAEFSFFLAVPTMLAVTFYSIFVKDWNHNGVEQKGYEMIFATPENTMSFFVGNLVAFVVAVIAIKFFIGVLTKYGFKPWGWYRIIAGILLLIYFGWVK
jgi:hypothetical protein